MDKHANLRKFLLEGPLQLIGATPQLLELITSEDNMVIWKRAFRHSTYDANDNYEALENEGDKFLAAAFSVFIRKKAPNRSPLNYTEWSSYYQSNEFIATLSDDLGLPEHLQFSHLGEITYKIKADVFESFCGALVETSNKVQPTLAYSLIYNFVVSLFNPIELDEMRALGSYTTVYTQTMKALQLHENEGYHMVIRNGTHVVTITATPDLIRTLNGLGYKINTSPGQTIGEGINDDKAAAGEEAYKNAITSFLIPNDVYQSDIKATTEDRKFRTATGLEVDLYEKAIEKAGTEGFEALLLEKPAKAKTNRTTTAILVGVSGNKKTNLVVRLFKNSDTTQERKRDDASFRVRILKRYLGIEDPDDFEDEEELRRPTPTSETGLRLPKEGNIKKKAEPRKKPLSDKAKGKKPIRKLKE